MAVSANTKYLITTIAAAVGDEAFTAWDQPVGPHRLRELFLSGYLVRTRKSGPNQLAQYQLNRENRVVTRILSAAPTPQEVA